MNYYLSHEKYFVAVTVLLFYNEPIKFLQFKFVCDKKVIRVSNYSSKVVL